MGRRKGSELPGLRRARARRGVTLTELADKSGVHRSTINQLENLRRGADLRTVYALAAALEVPEAEITGESNESNQDPLQEPGG